MNTYRKIDVETWQRRKLFEFYRKFDAPCFNISAHIDAGPVRRYAKANGESFFLLCLYSILRAANRVPQVRQRIVDGAPVEFDRIAAMTPIMTESELFQQIWCGYHDTFAEFKSETAPKVELAKRGEPAPLEAHGEDFICASCVPWLHFDSISHAELGFKQTVPILTWGRFEDGKIPVSVKFNHCFMDGLFVARFFEEIKTGFTAPESL